MARTQSKEFAIGTKAPNFSLINTLDDKIYSLNNLKGDKGTVLFFICNHCPYVIHINKQLVKLANDYKKKGINCIAISSNDIENYPQDAPHLMKQLAKKEEYPFPYLYDETQEVARAYNAACTPDFYIFDADLKNIYHGQFDDARPGNDSPVTGENIREALENLLSNKNILNYQKPSIGCGIKWKDN